MLFFHWWYHFVPNSFHKHLHLTLLYHSQTPLIKSINLASISQSSIMHLMLFYLNSTLQSRQQTERVKILYTSIWPKKVKCLELIFVSLALSQTPAEAAGSWMHGYWTAWYAKLSLVFINRPRRNGTLSWRWYTVALGEIWTHDLTITVQHSNHSATSAPLWPCTR